MKDNSNKDISVGFIIEPVHQNNKRENAHNEVQTIFTFSLPLLSK